MNIYEKDIFSQPQDLRQALKQYISNGYPEKIKLLRAKIYSKIIFTGMGSSYSSCLNANTILRNAGLQSTVIPTSQLLHYEMDSIDENTLLVIVSQSGRSGEIVEFIDKLKINCTIAALTNYPDSPLGKAAHLVLSLSIQPEVAVSTRTYLAPVIMMHLFAYAFCGKYNQDVLSDIETSLNYLEESIEQFDQLSQQIDSFLSLPPYITLIGRGYSMPTVDAGALFIKEVAKYPSIPFDAGQFRHGPYEMIGKNFSAILFAPMGAGFDMQIGLANSISEKGSKVILITNSSIAIDNPNILTVRQNYVSEQLAAIVNILPVQCIANHLAKKEGLSVGEFLYSSKVTTVQ